MQASSLAASGSSCLPPVHLLFGGGHTHSSSIHLTDGLNPSGLDSWRNLFSLYSYRQKSEEADDHHSAPVPSSVLLSFIFHLYVPIFTCLCTWISGFPSSALLSCHFAMANCSGLFRPDKRSKTRGHVK